MNAVKKIKRLKRAIGALESLKSVETARQANAISRRHEVARKAMELDSLDPNSSLAWHLFPNEWLTFRANLNKEISALDDVVQATSSEMTRMEKKSDHLSAKMGEISASHDEKKLADQMSDFISNSARKHETALGKLPGISQLSRKT